MSGGAEARQRLVSVALAGPWWTNLTYKTDQTKRPAIEPGVRVRVPVGAGTRVAVALGDGEAYDGEVREIAEVLEERPLLGAYVLPLLRWFCEAHLCGMGTAMKALLPAAFLHGDALLPSFCADSGEGNKEGKKSAASSVDFIYEPIDSARYARYAAAFADGAPTLVACPTHGAAKALFEHLQASPLLPGAVKEGLFLFPHSGARAEWKAWCRLSSAAGARLVVGAQSAATAPLPGVARIVVEDESNHVWRTVRHPVFNVRSLLSMRARIEGASLVLGGRMPSSRAFLRLDSNQSEIKAPKGEAFKTEMSNQKKKIFFVDLKLAYAPTVKDVGGALAVSEPLVRETERALDAGRWALWVLDRKGYAGEISCEECGISLRCPKCGGAMRWEVLGGAGTAGRVRCIVCGHADPVPDRCPACRGRLLAARRPGLEALPALARSALSGGTPVFLRADDGYGGETLDASGPGLIVGTRAVLEELDARPVGLVGWLDADGEARAQTYDARVRAFGLIWESLWRGRDPERRSVLLQTRRPGREWQKGLSDPQCSWRTFWRCELEERRAFSMPPFLSLIRLELAQSDAPRVADALADAFFEFWEADGENEERQENKSDKNPKKSPKRTIWIRTKKMSELRKILAPLFHLSRARRGYPSVTVWHD